MIREENKGPPLHRRVNTASSVGEQEGPDSNQVEDAYGKGNAGRRVPFVQVDSARECENTDPGDFAADQLAGVPDDCRARPSWDVSIGNLEPVIEFVAEVSQTTSQHNRKGRSMREPLFQILLGCYEHFVRAACQRYRRT